MELLTRSRERIFFDECSLAEFVDRAISDHSKSFLAVDEDEAWSIFLVGLN